MTLAGQIVELARYRIPAGERALKAQRIDGHVAVIDVPVDHQDRVYLVERHIERKPPSRASSPNTPHSETVGIPAVLATLRNRRRARRTAQLLSSKTNASHEVRAAAASRRRRSGHAAALTVHQPCSKLPLAGTVEVGGR